MESIKKKEREKRQYIHSCGIGEQIPASVKAVGKTKICKPCNWYMEKTWYRKSSHAFREGSLEMTLRNNCLLLPSDEDLCILG